MRSRSARLAVLAFGVAALAGCGGGGKSTLPAGASVAPKSTVAFISLTTDHSSPQWKQALELVKRFPGGGQAMSQAKVKTALSAVGPELDAAVLDLRSQGSDVALLTQPRNPEKLNKATPDMVHTVVDDWTVYANTRATLKKFEAERSSGSLSDDKAFQDAYADLPADALAKAFMRGGPIEQRFRRSLAQASFSAMTPISSESGKLQSLSAALIPEQAGVRLHLNANGNLPGSLSSYSPDLPAALPSGALAYVSFSDLETTLRAALTRLSQIYPQLDAGRAQLETLGRFSVDKDLLPLFGGEGAVAVYPGRKQPTLDVVFKISDEQAANRVLNGLKLLAHFAKGVTVTSSNGVYRIIRAGSKTIISVTVRNDMLMITNQASSFAAIDGTTDKLEDDPTYKQTIDTAGLPSHTSGYVYVNTPLAVKDGLTSVARQSNQRVNPVTLAQVSHLQGLVMWADRSGGSYQLTGFLGIK